ncbi:MAG: hypothetical protein JWO38_7117 [Gemmataceae bacterium]|nr:hypothetical protein [Gemmataceae bacterium]
MIRIASILFFTLSVLAMSPTTDPPKVEPEKLPDATPPFTGKVTYRDWRGGGEDGKPRFLNPLTVYIGEKEFQGKKYVALKRGGSGRGTLFADPAPEAEYVDSKGVVWVVGEGGMEAFIGVEDKESFRVWLCNPTKKEVPKKAAPKQ